MGEAERALSRRIKEEEMERRSIDQALEKARLDEVNSLIPKINAEKHRALDRLRKNGFPGGKLLERKGFLVTREIACWQTGYTYSPANEREWGSWVVLCADGSLRWCCLYVEGVCDLKYLQPDALRQILSGLSRIGN